MRYICTKKCAECDTSGTGNCVTPDLKGDPSLHDISCPVGNEPCWRPYNESVKGYATECPFCGSTKLKLDSKKINSPRYLGPGKWEDGHTGSIRCNSCHARGPTVTVWVPRHTLGGIHEMLKAAVLSKWNDRFKTLTWKENNA